MVTLLQLVTGGDVPDLIWRESGLNLIFCRQAEEETFLSNTYEGLSCDTCTHSHEIKLIFIPQVAGEHRADKRAAFFSGADKLLLINHIIK